MTAQPSLSHSSQGVSDPMSSFADDVELRVIGDEAIAYLPGDDVVAYLDREALTAMDARPLGMSRRAFLLGGSAVAGSVLLVQAPSAAAACSAIAPSVNVSLKNCKTNGNPAVSTATFNVMVAGFSTGAPVVVTFTGNGNPASSGSKSGTPTTDCASTAIANLQVDRANGTPSQETLNVLAKQGSRTATAQVVVDWTAC